LLVVLAAVLGTSIGHLAWHSQRAASPVNPFTGPGSGASPFGGFPGDGGGSSNGGSGPSNSSGGPANVGNIATKVQADLVDINTTLQYQQALAAGTGVVLTSNGVVLTNNHVIAGATKISATDIGNGKTYTATVVGYDESHDIAVLQLKHASGLASAKIGDSSKLAVGQAVVGIGNAGGQGGTPSSAGGSITALNQSITASDELDGSNEQLSGLIATNANIQSGDSGGPLVDKNGTVIGVDTAASGGFSFSSQNGQGFAIPINQAMSIHQQIKAGRGSASVHIGPTAFIGVLIDPQGSGQSSGAVINQAVAGGAAANAGLQPGDTITSINGQTVSTAAAITKLLIPFHPGDHLRLGWIDTSGQAHTSTVRLTQGPPA
ncbi:MAG: trypsin-like peptidase domain-containing protein, partial [Acidimicrobiaceae bacterium]|nr:trypsin-like peptidase domain-containing protein [Acidimicrobiaceae bacterium]